MIEQFFSQNDLAPDTHTRLHNMVAFGQDRAQWLTMLDQLGRWYRGPNLTSFLECVTRNQDKDLLLLVAASSVGAGQQAPVQSWLVAAYTGDRSVELVGSDSNSAALSAEFVRLGNPLGRIGESPFTVGGKPDTWDFRA